MWQTRIGKPIYKTAQENIVHQNAVYRWLTLGSNIVQTLINRHFPERVALAYIPSLTLAVRSQPDHCCLLGLGGAGVAHALQPYLDKASLTAIENSQDIIQIAQSYFMTDTLKHLHIIHQDAFHFIKDTPSSFKHIMVDLFGAYLFPAHCFNSEFFAHCHEKLEPNGTLAVNIANPHEQIPILNWMREHFSQSIVSIPVPKTSNVVVIAYKNNSIMPLISNINDKHRIKKLIWNDIWGNVAKI